MDNVIDETDSGFMAVRPSTLHHNSTSLAEELAQSLHSEFEEISSTEVDNHFSQPPSKLRQGGGAHHHCSTYTQRAEINSSTETASIENVPNGPWEGCNYTVVDFQVKIMSVKGNSVAIQLWDTAGQERFRRITRHYFRKSDAVIVVYNVTSEKSFLSVRNLMTSIEEVTDEHVVRVVIGNKVDLEDLRQMQKKRGEEIADVSMKDCEELNPFVSDEHECDENYNMSLQGHIFATQTYQSLFYEASAKSGVTAADCIEELAHKLLEKEDREMEEALKIINEVVAKKKCCRS
ncbi:Ras and EF-hand domain-containing protein [Holothuria leucospilota]|uniref:Ras and EF-hand domain-containing protein n=1 Tax=Holothuria leucospilota TaxID=206669 RepID=A0A9Q0YIZ1_HOLLE|nr:Ras and EF-hand domain-containing protein [Holothuria leucospilota]